MKAPRSIFRKRRHRVMVISDHPDAPYLNQAIEAVKSAAPGTVNVPTSQPWRRKA